MQKAVFMHCFALFLLHVLLLPPKMFALQSFVVGTTSKRLSNSFPQIIKQSLTATFASNGMESNQPEGTKGKSSGTVKGFGKIKVPDLPSIDEQAKQQKLKTLLNDYQQSKEKKIFEDQLKFPTNFVLKVIGSNDATFVGDILAIIGSCVDTTPNMIPYSVKESGKYLSITANPLFLDASQIYAAYDKLGKDSRVKFIL